MELVPWKRFGEMERFRREMDNLWSRFFGETPFARIGAREWSPSVDISETDDDVTVEAELPGLEAKDIEINVSGDVLTIKGEKKEEHEKKEGTYHYRERYSGSFQRSFQLPAEVQSDRAEANFKNGILTVNLPKAEETKKKRIEIKTT
jgi:HSP20 family protein